MHGRMFYNARMNGWIVVSQQLYERYTGASKIRPVPALVNAVAVIWPPHLMEILHLPLRIG